MSRIRSESRIRDLLLVIPIHSNKESRFEMKLRRDYGEDYTKTLMTVCKWHHTELVYSLEHSSLRIIAIASCTFKHQAGNCLFNQKTRPMRNKMYKSVQGISEIKTNRRFKKQIAYRKSHDEY